MFTPQNFSELRLDTTGHLPLSDFNSIEELVDLQQRAGMPVVRSSRWLGPYTDIDFFSEFTGLEKTEIASGRVYQKYPSMTEMLRVTGPISYGFNHPAAIEISEMLAVNPTITFKAEIPAPAWLLSLILEETKWQSYYPSLTELADGIATAYNRLLTDMYARGCRFVMMYDYAWMPLTTPTGIKQMLQGGHDINRLADLYISVTNNSIKGLPDNMCTGLYPANFDSESTFAARRDYSAVAPLLFTKPATNMLYIDFSNADIKQFELLGLVKKPLKLMLGFDDLSAMLPYDGNELVNERLQQANSYISDNSLQPGIFFRFTPVTTDLSNAGMQSIWDNLGEIRKALYAGQ